MPLEIERKFLVADASCIEGAKGTACKQGYLSVKGEAVVAHDRARDLVRASGTTVRLSVRKHAVDLDAIGGAFSTGVAWPQLDESSRALWTSLGWDAKSWARGPSPPACSATP